VPCPHLMMAHLTPTVTAWRPQQVTEFLSDFTARDVARLVAGVGGIPGLLQALPLDFSPRLMKAVYSKVPVAATNGLQW
jgi:hypothetical protein